MKKEIKTKDKTFTFEFEMAETLVPVFVNLIKTLFETIDDISNIEEDKMKQLEILRQNKEYTNPSFSAIQNDLRIYDFIKFATKDVINRTLFSCEKPGDYHYVVTYETLSTLLRNVDFLNFTIQKNAYEY